MCVKIPYRIIDWELGIVSLSVSELSEEQKAAIRENLGKDILTPELTVYYDDTRDFIVLNRDHGNYQTYVDLVSAYLTAEEDTRLQLFGMIPDCVKGFMKVLESILQRREHEG